MSAFVVDNDCINRIVSRISDSKRHWYTDRLYKLFGSPNGRKGLEAVEVELLAMNQDAVMQRYPDCDATDLPGPIDPPPYTYQYRQSSWVQAYKDLRCLRYQCAEGDVPERPLYAKLVEAIAAVADVIISNLPEYEAAAWG